MSLAAVAAGSAIGGGSMVHRLDVDWGLHRLAAVVDSGGSGDYLTVLLVRTMGHTTFSVELVRGWKC